MGEDEDDDEGGISDPNENEQTLKSIGSKSNVKYFRLQYC
jgi:hypothetical protein